ncbi:hypothetical protein [Paraburkholderia fynbosensis]|uniref:Uncharacterized protein n=1 Tax=Paraburkholderia fynbosensis TaxID=1200993 RepID=A0A6J5FC68_9BURK|nr:hypothetical protein [Paraburkholderia fynbosensis]CAB3776476.1 hypothetical protein LMG27177_00147 [Paraburkholderia fynbosensis]
MHARESCAGLRRTPASSLLAGQVAVHDLHAGSSIVAVEGRLQLHFRDRSLAWLGDAVPLTSITLLEGERFVTPQRGRVSISALRAAGASRTDSAAFIVLPPHAAPGAHGWLLLAVRHLAELVRTRWRRTV